MAQAVPNALVSMATITDLRAHVAQPNEVIQLLGLTSSNDSNGGFYKWNSASAASDDGFLNIRVTGVSPGAYERMGNANTLKGSSVFSGTGFVSSFNVTYSLPFTPAQVYVQAQTANAAQNWVTNLTSTGFTFNTATIPILGTNNISFTWLIIKQ